MSRMDYRCPNGPYKMSRLVCKQNRDGISKRDIGVINSNLIQLMSLFCFDNYKFIVISSYNI